MAISSKLLSKMRLASKLCKISTWVVGVLGLIEMISFIVNFYDEYSQHGAPTIFDVYPQLISTFLANAIPIFFFVIILYTGQTILGYLLNSAKTPTLKNEEGLEIISIPK